MRRLLTLIALVAGTLFPAAGAVGTALTTAETDPTGIGIRLVDAPVATSDNPRASVYIIDHVKPGSTIKRRIEVSNDTGTSTDVAVYPAAAAITKGSFVGLEAETPNELSTWTTITTPRLRLAHGVKKMVDVTIDVPSDAAPGEQYAVLWAQTTSGGSGAITQVSRVGIRIYLSVGPGGEPASAFEIESFTAQRDPSGAPAMTATIHNTGGRALDLSGELTLRDGPGGLSAGPFPVTLGTTLGRGETEPVTVQLDKELPDGPWKAHLEVTSGLLTETAQATLTFPTTGTGPTVPVPDGPPVWWWIAGAILVLVLIAGVLWFLLRRGRSGQTPPKRRAGAPPHTSRDRPRPRPAPRRKALMHRHRLVLRPACLATTLTACVVLSLQSIAPAVADQTAISSASITLEGGALSITAPSQAGSLGTKSNQVGATTVSGQLGTVQVTDARSAPAGAAWTATAISTAFTPTAGPAIGAASVGYTAGTITKVGTATYTANDPVNLTGVSAVVTATEITGDNTATWNPTIHVAVGADMAAGVYLGTITHSVS